VIDFMGRSAIGEPISVQPQESLDALPGFARSADPDTRSSCPAGLVEARVSVELHGVATVSRMWTCASVEDRRGPLDKPRPPHIDAWKRLS
jgi:hypothetical protein